ncbi:MAG: cellulase family glycosylhydrolase [Stagnimonas sp.]|nr:cellulase family glycosylhydrolase [Stagnimonas sp.]
MRPFPVLRFLLGLIFGSAVITPVLAYSVVKGRIVDAQNRAVQLRGLNWFGFETDTLAPHGLWARNWKEQLDQMQALGVNALRVPLCPEAIHGGVVKGVDATLNPDLVGKNSAELLDLFVAELDRRQMYVLLDHHRPDCTGQSELWYTEAYPESAWINDLTTLAERYRDVRHVIGVDLKNEPYGKASWGTGNAATDWNAAAERAARAVLKRAPHWLMFVEGIEKNPKCSSEGPHFWGENLEPFACTPLDIPPDRLVLAPHTYGPDVHPQPFFDDPTFPANMPAIWERNFGQFLKQGYAVILGEFGGRYGEGGSPKDRAWQDMLVQYLIERRVNSAFYWSWNPNSKDTGGLLQDDWKTIWPDKLALLKRLWSGSGAPSPTVARKAPPAVVGTASKPAPAATASPIAGSDYTLNKVSDWGAGYCADVEVRNAGTVPLRWALELPLQGRITQSWNTAVATVDDDKAHFTGVDWNARLSGGGSTHFGFCASREALPHRPAQKPDAATPATGIEHRLSIESNWDAGYCARVVVSNRGGSEQAWRVAIPVSGRIETLWKARYSLSKGQLTAEGEHYNRLLKPGEQTDFGFCVAR